MKVECCIPWERCVCLCVCVYNTPRYFVLCTVYYTSMELIWFLMVDCVYMRKSEECGDGVFGLNAILIFKRMLFSMEKDKRNF